MLQKDNSGPYSAFATVSQEIIPKCMRMKLVSLDLNVTYVIPVPHKDMMF